MSGMNSVNDRLQAAVEDDKYDGAIIAEVIENDDPTGIARIKVKVTNVLDSDQGPVPWCLPTKHSPFGQGTDYGVYGSPAVGSPVRIRFQNGDPNYPVYEADEYLAAHANPKFKDPKTWGYKDPGGSELFVNYETGAWEWTHQSGDTIKYDGDGNIEIHNVADVDTITDGDETSVLTGDLDETVEGDVTVQYKKTLNFTVIGNATIDVQGSLDVTVGAGASIDVTGTTNLSSTGAVNITGSSVNLN